MKDMIKKYRLFQGNKQAVFMYLIVPFIVLAAHLGIQYMIDVTNITNVSIYLLFIGTYADFFVLNGITSKDYPMKLFKNSLKGRDTIKGAVIFDQIRRFLQIVFLIMMCNAATMILFPEKIKTGDWTVSIICILLVYTSNTIIIMLIRNITTFTTYAAVSGLLCGIPGVILSIALFYRYCYGSVNLGLWVIVSMILAIAASVTIIRYTLSRFDKNYL